VHSTDAVNWSGDWAPQRRRPRNITMTAVLLDDVNAMRTFDVLLSFACKEASIAPNYRLLSNGYSFI
jgi:hypothetical protein